MQKALSKTSLNSSMNSTENTPKVTPSHGRRPPPAAFTVSQESSRKRPTSQGSSMYSTVDGEVGLFIYISGGFSETETSGICGSSLFVVYYLDELRPLLLIFKFIFPPSTDKIKTRFKRKNAQ